MANKFHKDLCIADGIHSSLSYEYADAATRLAATGFVDCDRGKIARQIDNNSVWMLIDDTVPTWVQIAPDSSDGDLYSCPVGVAIGDAVYASANNTVDQAQAITGKEHVIGIVREKPTTTTAIVDTSGRLTGFSGLTFNSTIYLSATTPGAITETIPTGDEEWVVIVGTSVDADKIDVQPHVLYQIDTN